MSSVEKKQAYFCHVSRHKRESAVSMRNVVILPVPVVTYNTERFKEVVLCKFIGIKEGCLHLKKILL